MNLRRHKLKTIPHDYLIKTKIDDYTTRVQFVRKAALMSSEEYFPPQPIMCSGVVDMGYVSQRGPDDYN